MNLADPAPPVEAATAEPVQSESIRKEEYVVHAAENIDEVAVDKPTPVEPAVIFNDPMANARISPSDQYRR